MDFLSKLERLEQQLAAWQHLGSLTLSDGTQLIGHTPHIGREAYLHTLFSGQSDPEIAEMEQGLRYPLPEDLKTFFRRHNGLLMFNTRLAVFGLRKSYDRRNTEVRLPFSIYTPNFSERPTDANQSHLFLAGVSRSPSFISLVYMDLSSGKVVEGAEAHSTKPARSWNDFGDFLLDGYMSLAQQYDLNGIPLKSA